jgi:polyhydroxyalkanoate synthesis regulator phasin
MATKKKAAKAAGRNTGAVLRSTWQSTVEALTSAQRGTEKQIKALLKKNNISAKQAQAMLKDVSARVQTQRKRAQKELESRLKTLQTRVKKERKVVGRRIDDAVRSALAALNIPSRNEVAELTRKVEELSRKIDSFKRRPTPRATPVTISPVVQG